MLESGVIVILSNYNYCKYPDLRVCSKIVKGVILESTASPNIYDHVRYS